MATVTKEISSYGPDEQGRSVRFEYDYDDATLRITALRCVNNYGANVWASATRVSNGLNYEHTFPAGTTFINIPTGPANRLQLFVNAGNGRLDGVEWHVLVPA